MLLRFSLLLLLIFGCIPLISESNTHVFTSTSHIAQLLGMQHRLAEALFVYADNETERVQRVREFAKALLRNESSESGTSAIDIAGHPVRAFLAIRRLGHDWKRLLGKSADWDAVQRTAGIELPTSEDDEGAADALVRLQDVYDIPADLVVRGALDDSAKSTDQPVVMSAEDCILLASRAFNRSLPGIGYDWIRLLLASETFSADERLRMVPSVVDSLQPLIKQASTNDQRGVFLSAVWQESGHNSTALAQWASEHLPILERQTFDLENYRKLCKSGSIKDPGDVRHPPLTCRYVVPHPAFLLAPIREELLSLDPHIVFLYDVVTDRESARLIEVSDPKLKRARLIGGRLTDIRISKSVFLKDTDDWSVKQINRRLGLITGLNVTASDDLQLGNYGIGGQYEPHMDSFGHGVEGGVNNRIATVLLYLNNVSRGGGTVFPRLGLRVMPVKNGALFWYNMRRNSSDIFDTKHAACPVLEGSKWVANKWIYYLGQLHNRPCGLSQFE